MINNVVLSYSPTDEKTPYKQREWYRSVGSESEAARSIVV